MWQHYRSPHSQAAFTHDSAAEQGALLCDGWMVKVFLRHAKTFVRALRPLSGLRACPAGGMEEISFVRFPALSRPVTRRTRAGAARTGLKNSAPPALAYRFVCSFYCLKRIGRKTAAEAARRTDT